MPSKATLVKIGIAVGAVVGGAVAGASIAAPVLSVAQSDTASDAADAVADTVDDATAPLTGAVERATDPAPGQPNGQVAPAAQAGNDSKPAGPHAVGDCTEESLSADDEAKVRAAVEEEVPGATIERIETECDGNGVYEAHLTKSDGTRATAFLDESFEVTSVQEGHGPGGPGHHGPGGRGPRPAEQPDADDSDA